MFELLHVFLPSEFFYTEWKTSAAQRRWERVHCSYTDKYCVDDVCSHTVTTGPSGQSFRPSGPSLQGGKHTVFSPWNFCGDSVTYSVCILHVTDHVIMCSRPGISFCMFFQGVVQYTRAVTSCEHTMCCDTWHLLCQIPSVHWMWWICKLGNFGKKNLQINKRMMCLFIC